MSFSSKKNFKVAHLSDLHFSEVTLNPTQFLSKRWVGNVNLLFFRKNLLDKTHLRFLPKILEDQGVDLLFYSGDFTTTSRESEYLMAKEFIEQLQEKNIETFLIPGNHDHYTKCSYKNKIFYKYFNKPPQSSPYSLKEDQLQLFDINEKWKVIGLDTTLATSTFSSQGVFSLDIEAKLTDLLDNIDSNKNIIVMNHFPFFQNGRKKNLLVHGDRLQSLLKKYPNIKMYLHGHTHRKCIADLRVSNIPIVLDCGTVGDKKIASWNLLDINENSFKVSTFEFSGKWDITGSQKFDL